MLKLLQRKILIFFFILAAPVFSANINVPSLELYTLGSMHDGNFGFVSRGEMDLLVEGGYKFGGRFVLSFNTACLETASIGSFLTFQSASIILRDIFKLPLNFTYFIGEGSIFCTGDIFPDYFGTIPLATRYRGFLYFPDREEGPYDGIHTINGTGAQIDFTPNQEVFLLSFYLYQDSAIDSDDDPETFTFEPGYYSADIRTALNFKSLKLEAFLGGTYPSPDSTIGYYRGGLLFYAAEAGIEFLAQLGIPRWSPLDDQFGIALFYLLFEPRVQMGIISIIPTFFWRPAYYHQRATGEQAFDINLNFQIGKPIESPINGGLEINFSYQTESAGVTQGDIRFKLSPYVQFITSGVIWEVRVNTHLSPLWQPDFSLTNLTNLIEFFLAVKAEF